MLNSSVNKKQSKVPKSGEFKDCDFVFNGKPLQKPLSLEEPSYIREFNECSSYYNMPIKTDEDEISSEGEFNDAKQMQVYAENDTEVYLIEQKKAMNTFGGVEDSVPQFLIESFRLQKK